jgi:uncharacterized membrane protein YqjE
MAKGKNKDYVSFWFWMFALFVMALPCVGFIMIIIWAFVGTNESRKNYFRALIAWFLIMMTIWIAIMCLGFSPLIAKQLQMWMQRK